MWIVKLALRAPYTFVVLAILILIVGALAILRTPTDIFPNIDIPVVSIIWTYNGLDAQQMGDRIVTTTERALTTTVDNIQHLESQSLDGIAVVKVFLQPNANVVQAVAQLTAVSQTQLTSADTTTLPAACPWKTVAPRLLNRSVTDERRRSEPETGYPRVSRISAIPLMPIPPIPIK